MKTLQMAIICHEVARVYSRFVLGDKTFQSWTCAPKWQKIAAVDAVTHYLTMGQATPEEAHAQWCKHKTKSGWKYAVLTDPKRKEHANLKGFDMLPRDQQIRDKLLCAIMDILKGEH